MSLRAPWSLRRRVVLGVVALLAVLAIAIGVVSVGALNDNLMTRLDKQLTDSVKRSGDIVDPGGQGQFGGYGMQNPQGAPAPASAPTSQPSAPAAPSATPSTGATPTPAPTRPVSRYLPGQAAGALIVIVSATGQIERSGVISFSGDAKLTTAQERQLEAVARNAKPTSVDLGGELGSYRVLSRTLDNGSVVITGLPMRDVSTTINQLIQNIVIATLIALVLAVLLGLIVVGVALRPLTRVAATATRVSELPLEEGEVALTARVPARDAIPTTEVGRVGAALNRLLDRVESAFGARDASERKLRRFVADASHELRTPLASIRGYAELSRRIAPDLPEDVRYSLERIDSESIRMTSMVEDLLLLARLDSGQPVRREPVDLDRLVIDAASDAHVTAPEHFWRLGELAEDVVVDGDEDRLRQVLANLLANARTHTPRGTTVEIGLECDGAEAVVTVADDGPGIPPELRETLFERFVRGDSSRSRQAGSTGLGLSIAQAIVTAHGGSISVDSEPGRTVFEVRLPLAETAE